MARFDLEAFLEAIERHRVTRAFLVPPILLALAKHPLVDRHDLCVARPDRVGCRAARRAESPGGAPIASAAGRPGLRADRDEPGHAPASRGARHGREARRRSGRRCRGPSAGRSTSRPVRRSRAGERRRDRDPRSAGDARLPARPDRDRRGHRRGRVVPHRRHRARRRRWVAVHRRPPEGADQGARAPGGTRRARGRAQRTRPSPTRRSCRHRTGTAARCRRRSSSCAMRSTSTSCGRMSPSGWRRHKRIRRIEAVEQIPQEPVREDPAPRARREGARGGRCGERPMSAGGRLVPLTGAGWADDAPGIRARAIDGRRRPPLRDRRVRAGSSAGGLVPRRALRLVLEGEIEYRFEDGQPTASDRGRGGAVARRRRPGASGAQRRRRRDHAVSDRSCVRRRGRWRRAGARIGGAGYATWPAEECQLTFSSQPIHPVTHPQHPLRHPRPMTLAYLPTLYKARRVPTKQVGVRDLRGAHAGADGRCGARVRRPRASLPGTRVAGVPDAARWEGLRAHAAAPVAGARVPDGRTQPSAPQAPGGLLGRRVAAPARLLLLAVAAA